MIQKFKLLVKRDAENDSHPFFCLLLNLKVVPLSQ
jgi:hypothetical protein